MKLRDGKYFFGLVKVGTKGQVVIPKEARDKYGVKAGDNVLVLGDENNGIWLATVETFDTLVPGGLSELIRRV